MIEIVSSASFGQASDEALRRLKPLIARNPFGTAKAVPFHNLEISIVVAPDGRVNRIVMFARQSKHGSG